MSEGFWWFEEILAEFRRIRRAIEDFERSFFEQVLGPEERTAVPLYEVRRLSDRIVVCADLAGVKSKEDIEISLEGDTLRIDAHLKRRFSLEGFAFTREGIERYHLEVHLPENIDPENVRASFKRGILEVVIPLKQKRVRIKVE
uniref:Hsp20/alpha crystallin family protein n=1 Tax=Thermofilum pendens TaxID=2269 RepID=A0A7C4FC34_THEPE